MEKERIPHNNLKNESTNYSNCNQTTKSKHSELLYKNDLMVNDAVVKDIKRIFADMKIYIDKENFKMKNQTDLQQSKISDLEETVIELTEEKKELENKVDAINERFELNKKDVDQNIKTITENHSVLEKQCNEVSEILSDIESDIENLIKKHSLIIENLCPKEDSSLHEMLKVYVKSLGIDLIDSDIEKIHLVGTETLNLPRPFLVTFTCYRTKVFIYSTWLQTRISEKAASVSPSRGQGINIKEYLTSFQETVFQEAVKAKEGGMYQDCWTEKGVVYVKNKQGAIERFSRKILKEEGYRCSVM